MPRCDAAVWEELSSKTTIVSGTTKTRYWS